MFVIVYVKNGQVWTGSGWTYKTRNAKMYPTQAEAVEKINWYKVHAAGRYQRKFKAAAVKINKGETA